MLFLSSLLAFLPPLQIFPSDDSLTVILLLLLLFGFGFGSATKKLEGLLVLPKRRKASFYRRMRCVAPESGGLRMRQRRGGGVSR